jgi:hypothetical protein
MTSTNDRNAATVRIYCDEDKRWKERVDPVTKEPVGGFEDPVNHMVHEKAVRGCLQTNDAGEKAVLAMAYYDQIPGEEQEGLQGTITVSNPCHR